MKTIAALAGSLAALVPPLLHAQAAGALEIRFCPAAQVRTYPLESRRDIRSLVLQNLLVINHGTDPVDVTEIDLSLMQGAEALDLKRIKGAELQQFTAGRPQAAGLGNAAIARIPDLRSGADREGTKLAGPHLDPAQALLLTYQTFAFRGKRDALA